MQELEGIEALLHPRHRGGAGVHLVVVGVVLPPTDHVVLVQLGQRRLHLGRLQRRQHPRLDPRPGLSGVGGVGTPTDTYLSWK